MGSESTASLDWGFEIHPESLYKLLQHLRKDFSSRTGSATEQTITGPDGKQKGDEKEYIKKTKDVSELDRLLYRVMKEHDIRDHFTYLIGGWSSEGDAIDPYSGVSLAFLYSKSSTSVERTGRGNYGSEFTTLGPDIERYNPTEDQKEALVRLQAALHFKELGLEVPFEEEWILNVNVG